MSERPFGHHQNMDLDFSLRADGQVDLHLGPDWPMFNEARLAILYVVIQLLGMAAKINRRDVRCWGLLADLMTGFVTDFVVTAGGA